MPELKPPDERPVAEAPARPRPGTPGPDCPIEDCPAEKRSTDVMCHDHWDEVPKAIRDRVWKHWRARLKGNRAAIALHCVACRDAIAAVSPRPLPASETRR